MDARVYTESEVLEMDQDERGQLYELLRNQRKLSPAEVQRKIGLERNGRAQIRQWENYGTICTNEEIRRRYFKLLGIIIDT